MRFWFGCGDVPAFGFRFAAKFRCDTLGRVHLQGERFARIEQLKQQRESRSIWDMAKNLYDVTCAKLGMNLLAEEAGNYAVVRKLKTFQRPGEQLNLL